MAAINFPDAPTVGQQFSAANGVTYQWNGTQWFVIGGASGGPFLPISGGILTGELTTVASGAGSAGFNLPAGTAPTTPNNGDVWTTSAGLFVRINGVTVQAAPLVSPTFTGTPAAPTATPGTNTTQLATTAFVAASFAPLASPTFTGKVTTAASASGGAGFNLPQGAAPTSPVNGDVWTTSTGVFAQINGATVGPLAASSGFLALTGGTMTGDLNTVASASGSAGFSLPHGAAPTAPVNGDMWTTSAGGLFARINGVTQNYAPLASPTFTGTPAAPTATGGTNTTQIATTAFVQSALASFAPIASPTFTGTPAAPTPTSSDSSTKLATTAFVKTAGATATNVQSSALGANVVVGTSMTVALSIGPLGASGQVWELIGRIAFCDITSGSAGYWNMQIWDGTTTPDAYTTFGGGVGMNDLAELMTIVTLSGATTFSLRAQGPNSTSNVLADGTRLIAKRLA